MKKVLFGYAELVSPVADAGRALLRLYLGLALALWHGLGKMPPPEGFVERVGDMGFPAPAFFAFMSGFAEFFCGLLLAVGLATRPAALFVTLNMLVVTFIAHGDDPMSDLERQTFFLLVAVFFVLSGGGRFSIDRIISKRAVLTTDI